MTTCAGPECSEPAACGGLCWGHHRQRARGKRLHPLRPFEHAEAVGIALANVSAEDDGAYEEIRQRFFQAVEAAGRKPANLQAPRPDGGLAE